MPKSSSQPPLSGPSIAGLFTASLLISIGTFWAFARGANDFSVFYQVWRLVLQGRGAEIYHAAPDRFLYAPGFAWILSPLALLPFRVSLAFWCFGKAAIIGGIIRALSKSQRVSVGLSALAVALIARPILIDFQYGQVNLIILGACAWALLRHCDPRDSGPPFLDAVAWALLGIAAVAKLFPLPLVLVPFLSPGRSGDDPRRGRERWGVVFGICLILAIPVTTVGFGGTLELIAKWRTALLDRGLPLESHNQSFSAFLHHYFSGMPTEIIAEARRKLDLGFPLFSIRTIESLSLAWGAVFTGLVVAWIFRGAEPGRGDQWIAALLGAIVLPSHLVWKPYFVMSLPLAILVIHQWRSRWPWIALLFILENLSGFDFIGLDLAAKLEAACILLWVNFGLYWLLFSTSSGAATSARSP